MLRQRAVVGGSVTETRFRPTLLGIGDSIIAGHPACFSLVETTPITGANITQFAAAPRHWTWANQGMGSQTTTQIAARFTTDVVNLKPTYVLINAGVNDISGGGSKATFLANWTTMLNACQSNGFIALALLILPWTNGTTVQMQARDDWNSSLVTLVATYTGFRSMDASSLVGVFRAGGDVGNLWDIRSDCAAGDGVHYNGTGYARIGDVVSRGVT
jgi:lysophospholipase L1-like esterase